VPKKFTRFAEFYPVYLAMHDDPVNRRLHLLGNLLAFAAVGLAVVARSWLPLLAAPALGNGFAWIGHYRFQRNRPGVFTYPVYGFIGSWAMTWDVLTGKLRA
jgi:hypothetical protein